MKLSTPITLLLFLLLGFVVSATPAHAATIRTAPINGLVGYWSMDAGTINGTKVRDLTNKGGNGTIVGGVTPVKGKLNEGLAFNGSTGYILASPSATYASANKLTVSAWIKTTLTTRNIIACNFEAASPYKGFSFESTGYAGTSGKITAYLAGSSPNGFLYDTGAAVNDGTWRHVAFTYDGSVVRFYRDGSFSSQSDATNGLSVSTNNLKIGADCNASIGNYFKGSLDDVRIYNRALSASEVKQVYQAEGVAKMAPVKILTNKGLVGWWTFDTANMGTTSAKDLAQNNTGWLYGSTVTKAAVGKIGQAVNVVGSGGAGIGSCVAIPYSSAYSPLHTAGGKFSFSFWVKGTSFSDNRVLFGDGTSWMIYNMSSNTQFYLFGSANGPSFSRTLIADGRWHNITGTYDGRTASLYLDSAFKNSYTGNFNTGTTGFGVGGYNNCTYGETNPTFFDDVQLYNRVLTQQEITNIYQLSIGEAKVNASQAYIPPTPTTNLQSGLVGFWDFSAGKMGTTSAYDASGNNNTGWLIGGVKKVIGKVGQGLAFDGTDNQSVTMSTPTGNVYTHMAVSPRLGKCPYPWLQPLRKNGSDGYSPSCGKK